MVLQLAPNRCRPEGGSVEMCGKIDREAPESTKKLKLFCVSCRKIKFCAGRKDMAVAEAGKMMGGGQQG